MDAKIAVLPAVGLIVLFSSCSAHTAEHPSSVSGALDAASFTSLPTTASATDEAGRVTRVALTAQGQFQLALAQGHTYRLALEASDRSVPIVFPRASGRLDASFVVRSAGASLALGQVHDHAGAPASGFMVLSATPAPSTNGANGDCDCVDDDPNVTCDDGSEGESSDSTASSGAADTADPTTELATADRNVPSVVDGCGSDGEGQDGEQGGEGE